MKRFFVLLLLFLAMPVFASQWVEIFEKQFVDYETIEVNPKTKIVKFWVKALRKDSKDKFYGKDYWFTMNKFAIKCEAKEVTIESIAIYDLKQQLITSDSSNMGWSPIIPDSYSDGYYRLFCIRPEQKAE